MSRLTTGISGAIALVLISGAAQFAMGRDLSGIPGRLAPLQQSSSSSYAPSGSTAPDMVAVNRGAKADRAMGPSGSPARLQTISLKLDGVEDTSVLVRMPAAGATPSPSTASSPAKPATRKPMAACEPVVSALTEVARRLQPGRCVT
ncbi:hypothetical protein [Bradyrhizobium erythrophlei]|jgi:hypothetical protein|uniref:Uncharacterized protein n=1 Tax=Bradyrhizobium erythrophlei TaxID=1437360 RepID=A0A1M7TIG5_9BRAD|nr:hypothetical protein [Bradyrhizobium erythrophlei]SHN70542.1 hypothetical protein SAMN05444170_1757 [Bradyrhizobium erythrophlei]